MCRRSLITPRPNTTARIVGPVGTPPHCNKIRRRSRRRRNCTATKALSRRDGRDENSRWRPTGLHHALILATRAVGDCDERRHRTATKAFSRRKKQDEGAAERRSPISPSPRLTKTPQGKSCVGGRRRVFSPPKKIQALAIGEAVSEARRIDSANHRGRSCVRKLRRKAEARRDIGRPPLRYESL